MTQQEAIDPRAVIFVVDDDAGVRDSTVLFLVHRGWTVRAFGDAQAFLDALDPDTIGCVLLDLRMPTLSGLDVQQEMLQRGIDLPIVFLTGHGTVQHSVMALKRGAVDFLEKPWDHDELQRLVAVTVAGHVAQRDAELSSQQVTDRRATLTRRELDVLEHLLDGSSSKIIGRALDISHRTVEVHRANLMRKMGVRTLAELLALLSRSGRD